MKAQRLGVVLALTLLWGSAPRAEEGGWEYIGEEDHVKTWRKEVPGSGVLAFRGETVADLHIGKIMGVFLDGNQRRNWIDRYADHKTLDTPTPRSEIYWIKFKLPFPASNRDYVLQAEVVPDEAHSSLRANIKSVEDPRKPVDNCCVRAQVYGTYYTFEALKGVEKTKLVVEVHTDPKGILPHWLVNAIQKKWPRKTLGGLVNWAARPGQPIRPEFIDWHKDAPAAPAAAPGAM